jgi:hypothetical protein
MATKATMKDETQEETVTSLLSQLTPLEQATYRATMTGIMLSMYKDLEEVAEQIDEVESLLPLAEAGLIELIATLPFAGKA